MDAAATANERFSYPGAAEPGVVVWGDEQMQVVGLTYRQLDYWSRQGYLKPENPDPGSGHRRHWPAAEVGIARAMVRLIACGFTLQAAHDLARQESTSERVTVPLGTGVTLTLHPDLWSPGDEESDVEMGPYE